MTNKKKSILFTGANGLIGKEVYKYFEERYSLDFDLHRIDKRHCSQWKKRSVFYHLHQPSWGYCP